MNYAIVLAAGESTRMQTKKNKVMHEILNKPIIGHLVDTLRKVEVDELVVVTGYQNKEIENYLGDKVEYAFQEDRQGTANAVAQVSQLKGKEGSTLLVLGDCAQIQPESIKNIFEAHKGHDLTLVSAKVSNPGTYRRIVRDNQGNVDHIADYRNLSEAEQNITEISLGVYCFSNELLFKYLPEIQDDHSTEELNIIKLVQIMKEKNHKVQVLKTLDSQEFLGVNDRYQLIRASQWLQEKVNKKHIANGVTIIDPTSTYIGVDVEIDKDVTVYPNNHIYGTTKIGENTKILPNSWLDNAIIGHDSTIEGSKITDSEFGSFNTVGPNAHIREHSHIGDHNRIGNYVEFKSVTMGDHCASAHLVYLGNTNVGNNVNIGCGVVTVNYDGKHKYGTFIGDNAFVGSNANLIAPIKIGKDTVIAAGSTVTEDVNDGDMAIARNRQENKSGYGIKFKNKEDK